jgi:hypothetical protein
VNAPRHHGSHKSPRVERCAPHDLSVAAGKFQSGPSSCRAPGHSLAAGDGDCSSAGLTYSRSTSGNMRRVSTLRVQMEHRALTPCPFPGGEGESEQESPHILSPLPPFQMERGNRDRKPGGAIRANVETRPTGGKPVLHTQTLQVNVCGYAASRHFTSRRACC